MFNSTIPKSLKVAVAAGFISALAFSPLALAAEQGKENLDASASKEITGEVVDMMCYVDHNADRRKARSVLRGQVHQRWWAGRDRFRRKGVFDRR